MNSTLDSIRESRKQPSTDEWCPCDYTPTESETAWLPTAVYEREAGLGDSYSDNCDELLEQEFNSLANEWELETSLLSSPKRKAMHPAYQQIIAMGPDVIPHILDRMELRGGHWFWALALLAGQDPVPKESHGEISAMREAWLEWGHKHDHR